MRSCKPKEKVPRKILDTFWRRRRDSNSRAGCPTYALSRGASSPLEYFSMITNQNIKMAERVGFEPTVPCGITGFQDQLLKPLGHLSNALISLIIIHYFFQNVNRNNLIRQIAQFISRFLYFLHDASKNHDYFQQFRA